MKTNRISSIVCALLAVLGVAGSARAQDDAGYALRFDGSSDFVRLSSTAGMLGAGWPTTKTVSLWLRPTGSATCTGGDAASCDVIFGDKPRTWGIARGTLGGNDRIWLWNFDGTLDSIGIPYTVGEWAHVALVHGGGVLTAYKNGEPVGSVSSGATYQGGETVLYLGGIINSAAKNWTFQGEIDEVQLWSTARTAAEISVEFNRLLEGGENGLTAYYQMSDGSGTALTDDSGHGWTGTLYDGGSGVAPDGPIAWVLSGAFAVPGGGDPSNTAPVADPWAVTTPEDTAVAVTLTGSDADGDPLTFRVVSPPSHGALGGTAPNLTYTPDLNFSGADSFSFVVNDGTVNSAAATVALTITSVNDDPAAQPDAASTDIDTPVPVQVLSNDADPDGDALTITMVGNPGNGIVSNDLSYVTYLPNQGFTGTDTFSYTISDGHGGTSNAEVTITIRPPGEDAGHALRFDGVSDSVKFPPMANMTQPGWESTKTVSLWVNPTGSPSCVFPDPASCDAIFGDRPRWWGISRGLIGGLDRIWVWNWDGAMRVIGVAYSPGEWVHIALVHGGGVLSAYRNGVLVGSVASGPTRQPNTGALPTMHVGGIIVSSARNYTFAGEIDEVRIWSTARSEQEINQDMDRQLSGAEQGLVVYYQMSNGSGTFLSDDTGHGWDAELLDGSGPVPADGPILWVPSGAFSAP